MKKSVKIALIVIAIIIVIAIVAVCAVFIYSKSKTPLTAEEFKTQMEEKGYIVADATYQSTSDDNINQIYTATSQDKGYKIDFYIFENADYAKMFYDVNKKAFDNSKTSEESRSSISLINYSKYTLSTVSKYRVITQIDNTVMYINADNEYTDTIKETLKELGY